MTLTWCKRSNSKRQCYTIALEILKAPITNTEFLGAFAKATGIISIESLEASIREKFGESWARG